MRVLMVSDHFEFGGAAIACSRLAAGFTELGVDVIRTYAYGGEDGRPGLVKVQGRTGRPVWDRAIHRFSNHEMKRRLVSRWCAEEMHNIVGLVKPDVINVHNIHGAQWRGEIVRACLRHAPVVWTMHDMWSFTGRCAYRMDCERLYKGCNAECPTSGEYPRISPEYIEAEWLEKKRLIEEEKRLIGACPSKWLADEARKGLWAARRVEVIPYGLDLSAYRPAERRAARNAFGISEDGPVLLTGSFDLNDHRKGLRYLVEALRLGMGKEVTVVTMGAGETPPSVPGCTWVSLGSLRNPRIMSAAYSVADVFVTPSIADNYPNMIMESLACGTPVVAFRVGGIPELVVPGETGWLVGEVSAESLREALLQAIEDAAKNEQYRAMCRGFAERNAALHLQAERYLELFRRVIL